MERGVILGVKVLGGKRQGVNVSGLNVRGVCVLIPDRIYVSKFYTTTNKYWKRFLSKSHYHIHLPVCPFVQMFFSTQLLQE